jgi:hypothetical protein
MGAEASSDGGSTSYETSVDFTSNAYHGDNYDADRGGMYENGYERGFEDSALGCSSDNPMDYITSCTAEGNEGYADGVADGGNFGNDK